MELVTKHFGVIEYNDDEIIVFDEGMPGFADVRNFILIEGGAPNDLFCWLQCVDDGDVAFALMDVYQVVSDYNPLVEPEMIVGLGDITKNQLEIYNITVIPEELREMRVNLKAPVVINRASRKGKQVIVSNEEYGIRHYIFKELEQYQSGAAQAANA